MPGILKYVVDLTAGAALLLVLFLVFAVDFFVSRAAPNSLEVKLIENPGQRAAAKRLKLAVTPTGRFTDPKTRQAELWDDMGKLLNELGAGYKHDEIRIQDLIQNPRLLDDVDVLFLTCAGGGEKELKEVLRTYVGNGGILYASDWRYGAIAEAFPDMDNAATRDEGSQQDLKADIVDRDLRELLGDKIELKFNLPQWKTAAFSGPGVKTLIQGNYIRFHPRGADAPRIAQAPLMVKFTFGKGTVIFTSFHNEKQNSAVEKQLLQYLVFSLVNAGVDAELASAMNEQGFTPQRTNLLSTPQDNPSVRKEYNNTRLGTLRFALGFRNEGAKLQLNIKSPEGKEYTWTGQSTVSVEVPGAAVGTWTYTVTALHLPYPNFPFTVTVAEKK